MLKKSATLCDQDDDDDSDEDESEEEEAAPVPTPAKRTPKTPPGRKVICNA